MSRKKGRTKTPIGITIDTQLLKQFDTFREENGSTRSKLIERQIKKLLQEKERK